MPADNIALGTPALTVNDPSDATIYGYGGITATRGAFISVPTWDASLLNPAQALSGEGTVAGIGWGVDLAPGSAQSSAAVDVLDLAMDIPARNTGVGGYVSWNVRRHPACSTPGPCSRSAR